MKKRFVIGYILLNIGIIMGAISVIFNLIYNIILKFDPEAFYAGVLIGTGLAWLLFIIPGSILVRKHEQLFKKIIGTIITLLGVLLSLGIIAIGVLLSPGIIAIEVTVSNAMIIAYSLVLFYLPFVLFYLTPGILLVSNIKARFIVGYEFLVFGIIGAIMLAFLVTFSYVNFLLNPSPDLGAILGMGAVWIFYTYNSIFYSIFMILGSIMVINHRFFVKKLFSLIVILLGIIPQIIFFVALLAQRLRESARPIGRAVGPEPELRLEPLFRPTDLPFFLIFFLIPFVLYLIPGILLLKSSKQNRSG
jgi:hypothetical protein